MFGLENILSSKITYYQKLPSTEKSKFVERVTAFIEKKEFIGREGLIITEEMKVLVAASAVQLAFGLVDYNFPHFEKILIYPQSYFNRLTKKQHKGEVNFNGVIALSWKDLQEGFQKPSDNYNLGLHEMAHALCYDKFKGNTVDEFFEHYIEKWEVVAEDEYRKVKDKQDTFFRKYAGTNKMEFFAVCMEYFFESPEQMKKELPELYFHTSILLNQHPSQVSLLENSVRATYFNKLTIRNSTLSNLIYTTSYNKYIAFTIAILAIVWTLVFSQMYISNLELIVTIGIFSLIFIVALFLKLRKYYFFENGYRSSGLLQIGENIISYNNIVSIAINEKNNNTENDLAVDEFSNRILLYLFIFSIVGTFKSFTQYDHILVKYREENKILSETIRIENESNIDIIKMIDIFNRNNILVKVRGDKWKLPT